MSFEEIVEEVRKLTTEEKKNLRELLARLRGFEGYVNRKSFKINPSAYKVFTTEPYLASRPEAVILGGGCSGNSSLSCLSRSWRSASGCVERERIMVRPSLVGR